MSNWTDEPLDDAYYADADTYYGIGEAEEFERTQPRGATPQRPLRQPTPPPVPPAPEDVDIFGAVAAPEAAPTPQASPKPEPKDAPQTTAAHPVFPIYTERPAYTWRSRRTAPAPKKDPNAPESGFQMYKRLRSEGMSAEYAAEQAARHQKEIMR